MKIRLKIESSGKQNCDFDLEAILSEVAISTSISAIEPALLFLVLPLFTTHQESPCSWVVWIGTHKHE